MLFGQRWLDVGWWQANSYETFGRANNIIVARILCSFEIRITLALHYLGGSFHSLSTPTTRPSDLQTPSFILRPMSSCSELFKLPSWYS